jgi:hypothetical protein
MPHTQVAFCLRAAVGCTYLLVWSVHISPSRNAAISIPQSLLLLSLHACVLFGTIAWRWMRPGQPWTNSIVTLLINHLRVCFVREYLRLISLPSSYNKWHYGSPITHTTCSLSLEEINSRRPRKWESGMVSIAKMCEEEHQHIYPSPTTVCIDRSAAD